MRVEDTIEALGLTDAGVDTQAALRLEALERELTECAASPKHFHVRETSCCWCELEKKSGVRLFGGASFAVLSEAAIK